MGREMLFPAIYSFIWVQTLLLAQTLTTSVWETVSEAFAQTPEDAQGEAQCEGQV